MNAAEALARLTAGSPSFEPVITTTGRKLEPADIALALAAVRPAQARDLLAYLYADQLEQLAPLCDSVRWRLKEPWTRERPARVAAFTALRLAEMRELTLCTACKGRGTVLVSTKLVHCSYCAGAGRVAMTEKRRAHMLGIGRSQWFETWKPRYGQVCALLDRWHGDGLASLRRLLT